MQNVTTIAVLDDSGVYSWFKDMLRSMFIHISRSILA